MYPRCPATRYAGYMAVRGTPQRVVRVDKETWDAYGAACKAKGTDRADDLRRHMRTEIKAYEAEQRRIAVEKRTADLGAAENTARS